MKKVLFNRSSEIEMNYFLVTLLCLTFASLIASAVVESKQQREINADDDYDDDDDDGEDVVYDERQTDGETNIRLHIKNFQIQVPESSLDSLQPSSMAKMIQNSIFKLFGIPYEETSQPPSNQQDLADAQEEQQHEITSNSMLQVNGNNLPAKFFLEISDFLMNNHDNDAVDDKRVETNHRQNAELYATEEIKIERLENVNNVKNETITISKKRYSQGHADPQNLTTFEMTENKFRNNITSNSTEKEDRFQQVRPIRLDTVVMQVETDTAGRPKTLREKVIWQASDHDTDTGS